MKLYRLMPPNDYTFAQAGRRGTWGPSPGVCPECTASRQERLSPLQVDWSPGSETVGDFNWPGPEDIVVKQTVYDELRHRFSGFEACAIEHVEYWNRRVPKRAKMVRLPYAGPPLVELKVTTEVDVNLDRSSARLERKCGTCGAERWKIEGLERIEGHGDGTGRYLRERVPRTPGQGIYVRGRDLHGADIFRVRQAPPWVLCNQRVRDFIEEAGFTNVSFFEMGELIE